MMYLLEKNEFIGSITNKLVDMRSRTKKENQDFVQEIIMELKRNSSQKIWEEFEMRFKEVHADFYKSLMEKYPDLTPNEVRLSAFLRLNMSTKEISAITHQSVKSINMARFRLRKKIGIDRDENLISFLTQL
jgi:DNA-binding CsgD family transcriptional regulator